MIPAPCDPVARLRQALDRLGDALGRADLDALLACEPDLGAALDAVVRSGPANAAALAREADAARQALLRCRRLGTNLREVAQLVLDPADMRGYHRDGYRPADGQATTLARRV